MATSASTGVSCCLRRCDRECITQDDERTEVKAFVVAPEQQKCMEAAWHADGQAVFHRGCWDRLVSSARQGAPLRLNTLEAQLVKEALKTVEYFSGRVTVHRNAIRIAQMLKFAKNAIAFTGAGISTSAGIGDFRGKSGAWTERDRKTEYGSKSVESRSRHWTYASLRPTYTHEAIAQLVQMGILKYVISQNVDGLHSLSGVPTDKISELHGNCFHEKCEDCGTRYERTFYVDDRTAAVPPRACPTCGINHRTGGRCERKGCNGFLMNTIINFGDNLEDQVISRAIRHARANDAVLCLGTSLRVSPACDMVTMGPMPHRLIICNRQSTPFDDVCSMTDEAGSQLGARVYADCDELMREVMRHVLGEEGLARWEAGRPERMRQYGHRRTETPARY